jgi:hypothetical protein
MTAESHEENVNLKSQNLRSQSTTKAIVADNIAVEPFQTEERPVGEFMTAKFPEATFNEYISSSKHNSASKKVAIASLDLSPVLQRHDESENKKVSDQSASSSEVKDSSYSSSLTQ